MGGIIGKLSFEHDETLARPVLEQMLATLHRRGTAGSGIHVAPGIALGWCGDVPASTAHPAVASNPAQTVRVVADAGLTNAAVLRTELEARGHVVRGRTDADLIAHAYDEWGNACVEHLRGPFACAIWDDARQRLLLARDGVGMRPLFFAMLHGHGVVFGSEIRALLQDPGVGREWCPQAIDAYLALGYVPAPLTVYQRISKIEPAQRLIVDGRRLHVEQYWDLSASAHHDHSETLVDAVEAQLASVIHTQLADAGANGILYSGGAASASMLAVSPVRDTTVVTIAMNEEAAEIARGYAAATDLGFAPVVDVASPDINVIAQQLATHLDEPVADPSAISQYSTFLAVRPHVSTAIAGHGAAMLFPDGGRPAVTWADQRRRELYTRGFAWELRRADPFARYVELDASRTGGPVDRRYADLRSTLPDNTLVVAERAAMAAGLELRFPFLEREVIELGTALPPAASSHGRTVHPLRTLLSRRLSPALMPPVTTSPSPFPWLAGALAIMVPNVLLGPRFNGRDIFSRLALQQLWDEHAAGHCDHSHRLWSLLMLELWFREFIDGDAVDEPIEYALLRAA